MQAAYRTGDPYLQFAIDAKLVPADATRASHGMMRDYCKSLVLGTLFGMQSMSLAQKLGIAPVQARSLMKAHARTYRTFWRWSQAMVDSALLRGHLDTCFGWRAHLSHKTRPTSLMNWPMQSHGSEILRLACCFLVEAGLVVVAPVHDAVLVECDAEAVEEVATLAALMRKASRVVLGGSRSGSTTRSCSFLRVSLMSVVWKCGVA
jgi:DNA polymerase I